LSAGMPDVRECIGILRKAGCRRRVIVHCCTVKAVADVMLSRIGSADAELVVAGALLHDLGRAVDHSISHAHVGAMMAADLDLDPRLVEIIRRHTGAGLDATDVEELGLPPGDYMLRTVEEKIVAHADNLVSDNRVMSHRHSADRLRAKGADRGADRIEALHKELSELCGMDLDTIRDIIGEYPEIPEIEF